MKSNYVIISVEKSSITTAGLGDEKSGIVDSNSGQINSRNPIKTESVSNGILC